MPDNNVVEVMGRTSVNYAEIKYCDIANGKGVRASLFVSGCRHRCPLCFNELAWSFAAGKPYTPQVEEEILESLDPAYVRGISILGGEPLEPENQATVRDLLVHVRRRHPDKDVWVYSGFTWEELTQGPSRARTADLPELLGLVDVLVDGRFVQALKDITLRFRGSSNQRIIDVPRTLAAGKLALWEDDRLFSTHEWE